MFGHKKLLSTGAQAEGLVVKASYMDPGFNKKLRIQVRAKFPDGSTREFWESDLWVPDVGRLFPGSVVPVRYDPAKQSNVIIDRPALKERHAPVTARQQAELEAQLDAKFEQLGANKAADNASGSGSSGGPVVTTGQRNAAAPESDEALVRAAQAMSDEELLRDPQAMAALLRQKKLAASTRDAAADDQLARLQKLGELHTGGVLTDAEFAEQKAKLLGH